MRKETKQYLCTTWTKSTHHVEWIRLRRITAQWRTVEQKATKTLLLRVLLHINPSTQFVMPVHWKNLLYQIGIPGYIETEFEKTT
jgi:hypothetical protein